MTHKLYLLVLAACAFIGCRDKVQSDNSGSDLKQRVHARAHGIFDGFHGNERVTLTVDKMEFSQVAGLPPYFLKVPGTNVIFFQTSESLHGTYHVYFLDTRTHIPVRADSGHPGDAIGIVGTERNRVWIESLTSNFLIIAHRFMDVEGHHYIDLEKGKVLKNEVWLYNAVGRATNHVIYEPPIGY